jgi:pilus assembly protein CpaB
MTKRLVVALVIALLISGLFTYFLSRRVAKAARLKGPQQQFCVAAAKPLDAGQTLTAQDLQLVEWHAAGPLSEGFSKIEAVVGRVVLYPLPKDEPIIERQLAAAGFGAGLTSKIPVGMRAISVRSDEVMGVAGFLLPGTHVDVLMTYRSNASPDPQTVTVLQDVVVLTAGQQIHPDPAGKPVTVNVVTLLLKPEDAEKTALAASLGGMYFVLRNGNDSAQANPSPMGLAQLTGSGTFLSGSLPKATRPPERAKPSQYEVETYLGNKRVVNDFK